MRQFSLVFVALLLVVFSCKEGEKETPKPVLPKVEVPTIVSIYVKGNELSLKWDHVTKVQGVKYKILVNGEEFDNPSKTFVHSFAYGSVFAGEIIATYPNNEQTSIDFNFNTPLSRILFYPSGSHLFAIDLHKKSILWQYDGLSQSFSSKTPFIFKNTIIVGNKDVRALNLFSGETVWTSLPNNDSQFLTGLNGVVDSHNMYIQNIDSYSTKLFAMNMADGSLLWSIPTGGGELVIGDYLYLASMNLRAFDKAGNQQWSFGLDYNNTSASAEISSQPVLHAGNLYFGDNIGRVYSVNAMNGKKNWSINLGQFKRSSGAPTIYEGNLIIPVENSIYSIDTQTGSTNWVYSHSTETIYSAPFISEGKIVVGTYSNGYGSIIAVNVKDGMRLWESERVEAIRSSPIVFEGSVYIGSSSKMYELDIENGAITWRSNSGISTFASPVIVIGGSERVIYPASTGMIQ